MRYKVSGIFQGLKVFFKVYKVGYKVGYKLSSIFQGQQVSFHGPQGEIQGFQGLRWDTRFTVFFQGLKVFFKVCKVGYKVSGVFLFQGLKVLFKVYKVRYKVGQKRD